MSLCLGLLIASGGCGHDDHDHHDHGVGKASGAVCVQGSILSYESFGRAFVATYCSRCHSASVKGSARQGAPADHDFETVEQIRKFAAEIDRGAAAGPAAANTRMPVGMPAPTDDERRKLGEWLACGAP
jgi:uncharacterized membrane protein